MAAVPVCCNIGLESLTGREEHPAIVAAKKELLGTSWDTTIQQDLHQLFDKIDMDCSGKLELREVVVFFKAVTDDISKENIQRIFNKLDLDISKSLDFVEFQRLFHHIAVAGWKKMFKLEEVEPSEEEMEFCFDLIDSDHDGLISLQEGLRSARLIKDRFGIDEVVPWMEEADLNNDHHIDIIEFKQSLKNRDWKK